MTCADYEILLHALIDGELDASHAREVEAHMAACPACATKLATFRKMREVMAGAGCKERASFDLRSRIEAALPSPPSAAAAAPTLPRLARPPYWRSLVAGFALGSALSAAVAATLVMAVFRNGEERLFATEIVSAHLRSLQPGHLTDVETSDQHTVKPWFNGKLDVAPPVVDLAAQGFTLVGGRLDYIDGQATGSIVYRRRNHMINLFVGEHTRSVPRVEVSTVQGFNLRHWTDQGLDFWAASDINPGELEEFAEKFTAAMRTP